MKNEVFLKKLGKKIVRLREEKEISQNEMARRLGTYNNQIRRVELGLVSPTITTLLSLSKELDIKISDLVNIE
jgi:transcriptional regulator with XRE-family HTH domain